jgi:predicted nucleic acid-binding Zn ribbon protein
MRALSLVVPSALVFLLQRAPLSDGKVAFAWSMAVGRSLDRVTRVRLEDTVLIVDAINGQWEREIRRARSIILRRIQAYLGESTVTAIDVRSNPHPGVKSSGPSM